MRTASYGFPPFNYPRGGLKNCAHLTQEQVTEGVSRAQRNLTAAMPGLAGKADRRFRKAVIAWLRALDDLDERAARTLEEHYMFVHLFAPNNPPPGPAWADIVRLARTLYPGEPQPAYMAEIDKNP